MQCVNRRVHKRSLNKPVWSNYRPADHMWPADTIFKTRELLHMGVGRIFSRGGKVGDFPKIFSRGKPKVVKFVFCPSNSFL